MNLIAFDTETHLITPTNLAPRMVCASVAAEETGVLLTRDQGLDVFESILADPDNLLIGANIAFDLGVVINERPDLLGLVLLALREGKIYDVQIAQALDAIARGHLGTMPDGSPIMSNGRPTTRYSLATCVRLVLGRDDAKKNDTWRLRYAELEDLPHSQWPEEAKQYPIDDAINTLEVARVQLGSHENLDDMPAQVRAAFAEHLGSIVGLTIDPSAVADLDILHNGMRAEYRKTLIAEGLIRQKGSKDTTVIKRLLLQAMGAGECQEGPCKACEKTGYLQVPGMTLTAKGKISISREVLEGSTDASLQTLAADGHSDKIISTYLPFLQESPSVHSSANVLLASGRSSYDGPIQQLPREGGVRECFIGGPGYHLISADYAQLELCTWAQICLWVVDQSAMADALVNGQDLHSVFAAGMLGWEYAVFMKRLEEKDPIALVYRHAAKSCNFGFPGGMGPLRFVMTQRAKKIRVCAPWEPACDVRPTDKGPVCIHCLAAAKRLRTAWFQQWPEAQLYFDRISTMLDDGGRVPQLIPSGVSRWRGGVQFSEACNTMFQGLAADGAKHALWSLTDACWSFKNKALAGTVPVLFLHDEILSRSPIEKSAGAALEIERIMVEAMREFLPDVGAGVKVKAKIMERWSK